MIHTVKQGVFTKTLQNGCTNFYIKYSLHDKQFKVKLGSNLDGWTTYKAYEERLKRIHTNTAPLARKAHMSLDMMIWLHLLGHRNDRISI